MAEFSLSEIAEWVSADWDAANDRPIVGLESLDEATDGQLTFFGHPKYEKSLQRTRASAVLVPAKFEGDLREDLAVLRVANPSFAFGQIYLKFNPPSAFVPGVHPRACIAEGVRLDPENVAIEAGAVIQEGAFVGAGSTIGANAVVGRNARIGDDCLIHPNATIADGCVLGNRVIIHSQSVVGSDGFGYETVDGRHEKVHQLGVVHIDDDVEVGACTSIDRARFGRTHIGEGTKIDNHVQIAHNVEIGRHCIIVAQCGIAGSARIGDYTVIAAQSGVAGHLEIGPRTVCAGRSGVTKDLEGGATYMGYPAQSAKEEKRQIIALRRLPDLINRIKKLERGASDAS